MAEIEGAGFAAFAVHATPVWAGPDAWNAVADNFMVIAEVTCDANVSGCPFTRKSLAFVPCGTVNVACRMRSISPGFEGSANSPRTTFQQDAANCCGLGITLLLNSVQS